MITKFLWPAKEEHDFEGMDLEKRWFQLPATPPSLREQPKNY